MARRRSTNHHELNGGQAVTQTIEAPAINLDDLRKAIQDEYALVADEPEHGFHFLVGRPLAHLRRSGSRRWPR